MGVNKIDDIFKSRLSTKASLPSDDNWSKLEMMLDHPSATPKRGIVIWRVAVAVLVIGSLWGYGVWESQNYIAFEHNLEQVTPKKVSMTQYIPQPTTIQPRLVKIRRWAAQITTPAMAAKGATAASPEALLAEEALEIPVVLPALDIEEKEPVAVKVVYKRGPATQTLVAHVVDTTHTPKIKKILDQARTFDPSDVWADIRDAKDRVLNDPFASQREQRQKLK
ncbi:MULTISPECIES: hypothetical protein [Reichenbachiella]|uniref:Uncharacterized protein n=1 Tax=Reichenbachiella agariperforans TaxID=156994 RepID=A0A1M6JGG2_REIAG|nr:MULTISPECIES: hypothetical protein [Reichenbachiella]RJE74812.1 hypothetical protein BGP76_16940 [Reichenbachiella sp. MSK19-1]SHJ45776.1 hypothetical protein SAMN04488028_101184 [Reichenbachiella agariperforans]